MGNEAIESRLKKTGFSSGSNERTQQPPELIRDRAMLRRTGMQAVSGEPVLATVDLACDGADVGMGETARHRLGLGNPIERVDSCAKVAGRAKGGGTR
jgi:hypothetical protein